MANTTFNDVTLTNAVWVNEFENSAIENSVKHTEDGRKFVYQRKKKQPKTLIVNDWASYQDVLNLAELRDAGEVGVLTLADGRTFNCILDSIDGLPILDYTEHDAADWFEITLNFIEV